MKRFSVDNKRFFVDYIKLEIRIVNSKGKRLKNPWLALIIDKYCYTIIGSYLNNEMPSIKSTMRILHRYRDKLTADHASRD